MIGGIIGQSIAKAISASKFDMSSLIAPRSIALLWAGALCALYLIEFPARFGSAEASYTAALDIGRLVFERLSVVELGLWLVMAGAAVLASVPRWLWLVIFLIAVLIGIERWYLLPELAQRSADIVAAESPGDSAAHRIYSSLELVKGIALLVVAVFGVSAQTPAAGRA